MTIHRLESPCWRLYPSPYAPDDDEITPHDDTTPHYPTQDKAGWALAELMRERVGDPEEEARLEGVQPKQEDNPCWVGKCDQPGCGETWRDDASGGSHVGDPVLLEKWMTDDGWTVDAVGNVRCRAGKIPGEPAP